jgi:hypothetical protein
MRKFAPILKKNERQFFKALKISRLVFHPGSPQVANTKSFKITR